MNAGVLVAWAGEEGNDGSTLGGSAHQSLGSVCRRRARRGSSLFVLDKGCKHAVQRLLGLESLHPPDVCLVPAHKQLLVYPPQRLCHVLLKVHHASIRTCPVPLRGARACLAKCGCARQGMHRNGERANLVEVVGALAQSCHQLLSKKQSSALKLDIFAAFEGWRVCGRGVTPS